MIVPAGQTIDIPLVHSDSSSWSQVKPYLPPGAWSARQVFIFCVTNDLSWWVGEADISYQAAICQG